MREKKKKVQKFFISTDKKENELKIEIRCHICFFPAIKPDMVPVYIHRSTLYFDKHK